MVLLLLFGFVVVVAIHAIWFNNTASFISDDADGTRFGISWGRMLLTAAICCCIDGELLALMVGMPLAAICSNCCTVGSKGSCAAAAVPNAVADVTD